MYACTYTHIDRLIYVPPDWKPTKVSKFPPPCSQITDEKDMLFNGEIVSSLKFWPQKFILFRSRAVSVCATATFHVPVFVDSSGVSLFTLGVHS